MTRHKKAPEFQCHIKYKNELPLPPIAPYLMDASLTLPVQSVLEPALTSEATVYQPTTLESGTRHFTLPAELLKFSVFNFVDLERFRRGATAGSANPDDKEILMPIEELERKLKMSSTLSADHVVVASSSSAAKKTYSRPEVTWLRRTEYISSLRSNAAPINATSSSAPFTDDAKAQLAEPVGFEEVLEKVEETFESVKNPPQHPLHPELALQQSFPLLFPQENGFGANFFDGFTHCLFLGESVSNPAISSDSGSVSTLLQVKDEFVLRFTSEDSSNDASRYQAAGELDIQRTESSSRNLILMLPMDTERSDSLLVKISANFSVKKRRSAQKNSRKSKKFIQVSRN